MTKEEYLELGRKIRHIIIECNQVLREINGKLPKRSKAITHTLSLISLSNKLYYQLESDLLKNYPNTRLDEYGR